MRWMKSIKALVVFGLLLPMTRANAVDAQKIMDLLPQWMGGHYSTRAQYDADQASEKRDEDKHRLMFQIFKKFDAPNFEGVLFFEQGSMEGTTDPEQIWRAGVLQFIVDPKLGTVRHRELAFKDQKKFFNAHLNPGILKTLTPDMVTWDPKCDFFLSLSKDGRELVGTLPEKSCAKENPGTGKVMYAQDKIVIKPGEFWFLGRYIGEDGKIVWGNEGDELNKMVRFASAP